MGSQSQTVANASRLAKQAAPFLDYFSDSRKLTLLEKTHVDWETGRVVSLPGDFRAMLVQSGHLSRNGEQLTAAGLYLLGRLLVDLDDVVGSARGLENRFEVECVIASGNNSVTYKARNTRVNRHVVLKVLRPGTTAGLEQHLQALGRIDVETALVHPSDLIDLTWKSLTGDVVPVQCLVFPFVDGRTLQDYLATTPPLSPYFFESFVRQVGGALAALEAVGAYHGDLHAGNILVHRVGAESDIFKVIDVSFGLSVPSIFRENLSDALLFRAHLWNALVRLQRDLPRLSVQKHLGAKLYFLLRRVISDESLTFVDIQRLAESNPEYEKFSEEREEFLRSHFKEPAALGLLRHEEITDPAVAVELFEPFPPLFDQLKTFGNSLLFGERGSGKSTYLAALAFFPEVASSFVDPETSFGVYFACRQGEFKLFSSENVEFSQQSRAQIKHILILKIIRRVIATLAEGVTVKRIAAPSSYSSLYAFLQGFVENAALGPYGSQLVTPLDNLHAALQRNESRAIDQLFAVTPPKSSCRLLDEAALRDFLTLVRKTFPRLERTQFFLLFDDAGEPNVAKETQKIINDLLASVNAIYCVKVSAEAYSYELDTSAGKALETPHDYTLYDSGHFLAVGGGVRLDRLALRSYFKQLLAKRLKYWKFKSFEIESYLGFEHEPLDALVSKLARSQRNAYYSGWEVIWQIADRTTRSLLEIVSEVFAAGEISPTSEPRVVSPSIQNEAVRRVSERRLRALTFLPGKLEACGGAPLGRHVWEFASSFGRVAKLYLERTAHAKRHGPQRHDEKLAIERNDSSALSLPAQSVLEALLRFGVLNETRYVRARDDKMVKPLLLFNRVFCPAFGISFRRDSHLRLSRRKLEMFLVDPLKFVSSGTHFLEAENETPAVQRTLE